MCSKNKFGWLGAILLSVLFLSPSSWAREINDVQKLTDIRYPAVIYTPAEKNKTGDMIFVFSQKQPPQALVESWKETAKSLGWYVLAVEIHLRDGEQPTAMNQWILNLKTEMMNRYGVKRFYLVGQDDRAHYVSYFGLSHPNAFIAYAAIQGSWAGPFLKIEKPTSRQSKQAPFFIAMNESDKNFEAARKMSAEMISKGYVVHFVVMNQVGEESSASLRKDLISWFKEQEPLRSGKVRTAARKPFKNRVSQVAHDFIAM